MLKYSGFLYANVCLPTLRDDGAYKCKTVREKSTRERRRGKDQSDRWNSDASSQQNRCLVRDIRAVGGWLVCQRTRQQAVCVCCQYLLATLQGRIWTFKLNGLDFKSALTDRARERNCAPNLNVWLMSLRFAAIEIDERAACKASDRERVERPDRMARILIPRLIFIIKMFSRFAAIFFGGH